jgi:hypothetical protein
MSPLRAMSKSQRLHHRKTDNKKRGFGDVSSLRMVQIPPSALEIEAYYELVSVK